MRDIEADEAAAILKASRMGVLGLCEAGKAYALPLFYGYDGSAIYFHAEPGLKDEYIDDTDEACFVVVRMERGDDWESVHAFGPIERLTRREDIASAKQALSGSSTGPTGQGVDEHFLRLAPTRYAGKASAPAAQA